MTIFQCTKCDKIKDECQCESPNFIEFLDKQDHKQIDKDQKRQQDLEKHAQTKAKGMVNHYYVESILLEGKPYFLCNNVTTGEISTKPNLFYLDQMIKPLDPSQCGYLPYDFTVDEIQKITTNKLSKDLILDKIKEQISKYVVLEDLDHTLILGDVMLTYEQEHINTIHFLFVVGETESGKSTIAHFFRWLGYRCLYGEDIPNADIYNFLGTDEEGAGTIAEDEAQEIGINHEKIRTYKNSYSKGALKPRIIQTMNSKKQVYYKTFCFKVFCGEKIPDDKGFRERLAVIHMIEGSPKSNIKRLSKEEKQELLNLRKALLAYKVQNIQNSLPEVNSGLTQRDQELWEDFLRVLYDTKYSDDAKKVVDYYTKQRHESIWNSIEARMFKLILRVINVQFEARFEQFWDYLVNQQDDLAGRLEKETFYPHDYPQKITRNYLASLFEGKFHAIRRQKYFSNNGKQHKITVYQFDENVIKSLSKKYNVEYGGLGGQGDDVNNDSVDGVDHVNDSKGRLDHWVI